MNLPLNDEQAQVLEAALVSYIERLQPYKFKHPNDCTYAARTKAVARDLVSTLRGLI